MSKRQISKKESKQISKKESNKNVKPTNHETQELRRAKEKEIIDNLNLENIQKYLKKLEMSNTKDEVGDKFTTQSIEKIALSLENGSLMIPENSFPLPQKPIKILQLTYQEQKGRDSKEKKENMIKKIQYFYEQIRGENEKIIKKDSGPPPQFKQILTRQQHQRRIRQLMQEKQQRQKRLQQLQQQQERKQKDQHQKQLSLREAQQKKNKLEKIAKIQENMTKRKYIHDKILSQKVNSQEQRSLLSKQPKMYQEMEAKYKSQILLPYLEEKKNKLKQIRDFKKQFQPDAIKQHQKQYILKSLQKSRVKKDDESQTKWKYQAPAKTERTAKFLEDEEIQLKKHLQSRKRRIQQMQHCQQIFKVDLKQKYKPIIDEMKRKQIENRYTEQQRKRDKPNTGVDQREIGNNYLQIAKKMKRSQSVRVNGFREATFSQISAPKLEAKISFLRSKNHSQEFYEDARRKKIQDIVNSEQSTANEKYMMLKMETQKLGEKIKQKQHLIKLQGNSEFQQDTAQLILSSIKAKIGIVNLLKQKNKTQRKNN